MWMREWHARAHVYQTSLQASRLWSHRPAQGDHRLCEIGVTRIQRERPTVSRSRRREVSTPDREIAEKGPGDPRMGLAPRRRQECRAATRIVIKARVGRRLEVVR